VYDPHGKFLGTVSSEEAAKTRIRNACLKEESLAQQGPGEATDKSDELGEGDEIEDKNSTDPQF